MPVISWMSYPHDLLTGSESLFLYIMRLKFHTTGETIMTQDELKKAVGWAALQYVQPGTIVGVGTGSTAAHFIDALGTMKGQIEGAVSSSDASTEN